MRYLLLSASAGVAAARGLELDMTCEGKFGIMWQDFKANTSQWLDTMIPENVAFSHNPQIEGIASTGTALQGYPDSGLECPAAMAIFNICARFQYDGKPDQFMRVFHPNDAMHHTLFYCYLQNG